jgi:hypothetical protein
MRAWGLPAFAGVASSFVMWTIVNVFGYSHEPLEALLVLAITCTAGLLVYLGLSMLLFRDVLLDGLRLVGRGAKGAEQSET